MTMTPETKEIKCRYPGALRFLQCFCCVPHLALSLCGFYHLCHANKEAALKSFPDHSLLYAIICHFYLEISMSTSMVWLRKDCPSNDPTMTFIT